MIFKLAGFLLKSKIYNSRGVLEGQGYKCVEVPYDQFLLSGGAVRCSVLDIAQTR